MAINHQLDYTQDLGGNHVDYAPVVDPTTDWSAAQVNAIAGTVVGLSNVTPAIVAELSWTGTTPYFTYFRSSLNNVTYTLTRVSTGIVSCVINIAQSSIDGRAVSFAPSTYIVTGRTSAGAVSFGTARTYTASPTQITIYIHCYSSALALQDADVYTIQVF